MKIIIRDNQAGFVTKNGVFVKMVTAGTYHFPKALGYEVHIEEMTGEVDYSEIPYQILQKDETFRKSTVHMSIPDGYAGFIYVDNTLLCVASRREYNYWNVFETYSLKLISMEQPEITTEVTKKMLSYVPVRMYKTASIGDGECGLLYYNNILQKRLSKGVYSYWTYNTEVTVKIFDLRQQKLDIVGQEILTKDKIGIRMNMVCMYRISNVEEFVEKITNLKDQLYSCVQLVLREQTSNYKLDEILELKEQISKEVFESLKKKEQEYCVEILNVGIKDIILPGEIRDIMNTVLVAEKTAQANVISRREEVASTRSLLNTAKLMEDNKTLYKLKELEYLERICDKVGEISVNGNGSLIAQLGKLMGEA